MANFFDFLDPRNAPGVNLFMGKATDPLAQQAKENNQKGQIFDKNSLKGDARLLQGSMPGGAWLNAKLDASQRQPSYEQLQQDPSSYPQFSSLLKPQPQLAAQSAQSTQQAQPVPLGQSPANAPLQSMPDLQTLIKHPMFQQWLGSLPQQ